MRRGRAIILLALLLAGCTGPDAPDTVTTTPGPPPPPQATVALAAIDGRWDFDAAEAARLLGAPDAGHAWLGEVAFGAAAGDAWALDAAAARLLGAPAPPAQGEMVLREDAARAAGAAVGDELDVTAWTWAPPLVTAAFEMDRVRPCDPRSPVALCIERMTPEGRARLRLVVPPGARDLRYHPDVVELRAQDYPAHWVGEFIPPDGARIPFQTAARTRNDLDPPGIVRGPVAEGTWFVEFELTMNGTRAPGAVAGFITYRTPGFAPFDTDAARESDPALQTRAALALASERSARLRVSALAPADGVLATLGIAALLAPEDARLLLNVSAGNATALVLPYRAGDEARAQAAVAENGSTPGLRALRVRPLVERDAPPPAGGLRWAPPPEADTLAGRLPPGGEARLNGTLLAPGIRILALPVGPHPWSLVAGAHWRTEEDAALGMAASPHLVLVSDDLAREAGLDPATIPYTRLDLESGAGPRTVFAMGAVSGGPPRTVWMSAALLTALASPAGGRTLDGGLTLV